MLRWISIWLVSSLLWSGSAGAHDFWLAPSDFELDEPGDVAVAVMVGHAGEEEHWSLEHHRVSAFRSISLSGVQDQRANNAFAKKDAPARVTLEHDGLHVVTLESFRAFSELPNDRFMKYAEDEGLTQISAFREANGDDGPGLELYSRFGKTLVTVGDVSAEDRALAMKPVGGVVEITPTSNIFDPSAETLSFKVDFRGRALAGAKVHLISLDGRSPERTIYSDADGVITTPNEAGPWMLHVVWSVPETGLVGGADYSTVFSSLTYRSPAD